ncbi:MAG: MerR family transcriptional regulator [Oscillospiraceae bacterium]|jgi:DNA-binding transcriptional MerR regulator|nr:MerR family transcriptional regulator [Oscillospiraceae bacterium]
MTYTIKEASQICGIAPHVLRFYEKEGLIPGVGRTDGGARRYSEAEMECLSLVQCLKNTGMPIKRISEFIKLEQSGDSSGKRLEILRRHKSDVEEQIQELQNHLNKVKCKIDCYSKCEVK